METTQDVLARVSRELEIERARIAAIKASVEYCENLPSINTYSLLNLPTRVGRAVEH